MANSFEHISIGAVKVLARLAAKRAVQAELRSKGVRVTLVKPAAISAQAAEYLASDPELYANAKPVVERMILAGEFGKRAQRELRANLTTNAQKQSEPISTTSALQISGEK
jgi:NAD(P)-dependent dehydrogenase (short-subunit alcohol dehydrogenase family)